MATIYVDNSKLISYNAAMKGILNTIVREFAPSAYAHKPILIVSHSFLAVASAIYDMKSLHCGTIYTIGFAIPSFPSLAENTQHCRSLKFVDSDTPFAVISALTASDAHY
jgi:hypothetical protein